MLKNVYEYNGLSGNCVSSFLLEVSFFHQMFRSKDKKVKTSLKLNVLFTPFVQFLVENHILFKLPPFQLNSV